MRDGSRADGRVLATVLFTDVVVAIDNLKGRAMAIAAVPIEPVQSANFSRGLMSEGGAKLAPRYLICSGAPRR